MNTRNASEFAASFRGIYPAAPTPIDADGQIDEAAIPRITDFLLDGGVHGLWVLGSGGEFPMLSPRQRAIVAERYVDAADRRVPVVVGVSDTGLDVIKGHVDAAHDAEADAIFMISPFYFHLNNADIRRYFEAVADHTELPLVIYHNSHNSKIHLDLDWVTDLSAHPRVVGIKDAGCEFGFTQRLLHAFRDREDFVVFQGDDRTLAASFLQGAEGAVAAVPVVAPGMVVRLYEAAVNGRAEEAYALQAACTSMLDLYGIPGEPDDSAFIACQKAALELLGLCKRHPVQPCAPLDPHHDDAITRLFQRHRINV